MEKNLKYRVLTKLSPKVVTYDIFSFDIETYSDKNIFLMGSFYGKNLKITFWDKIEMIKFIIDFKRFQKKSYIFATNLQFDILALFGDTEYFKDVRFVIRGSDIIRADFRIGENTVAFLDTMNYIKMSVKRQGDFLNFPKLEGKEIIGRNDLSEKEKEQLREYNLRDCEITYRFACFLQKSFNELGCELKVTVASCAMNLFRKKYLDESIFGEREHLMNFIFKSYYGGRTEVFTRGKIESKDFNQEVLYYYDVNSLYPSVMHDFDFPDNNKINTVGENHPEIIDKYHGVADVTVECPEMRYPLLPFRSEEGKLIFPTGKFRGVYTHIELRKAVEIGYKIIKHHYSIYYKKTHNPFKKYVNELYDLRLRYKSERNPMELTVKLLLNSLYGKFGQRPERDNMLFVDGLSKFEYDSILKSEGVRVENGWIYFKEKSMPAVFCLPIYASYITAYARLRLYEYMTQCKDVLYVDTDSIITPQRLHDSKELGKLKLEHSIKKIILIKPKMYAIDDEIFKIKGVPKINNMKNFLNITRNEKYDYVKFVKLKEAVKRHKAFNEMIKVSKLLNVDDTKRLWTKEFSMDGFEHSTPLKIVEG